MSTLKNKKNPTDYPESLRRLIPPQWVSEEYIHRTIHGQPDFHVLDYALSQQQNVLLYGPTGPGKTMLCRAYASSRNMPYFGLTPGGAAEPTQLFGKPTLRDGDIVWVDGPVTAFVRHGGVLLVDEVNFIPPAITSVLHPLLDGQRYIALLDNLVEYEDDAEGITHGIPEVVKAHPELLVVSAYNPGYIGTEELNEAFKNRFAIKSEWDYSEDVEKELVASQTLLRIANELRRSKANGDIETPCSTNMLKEFEMFVEDIGLDFAVKNFISAFTEGDRDAVRNAFEMNSEHLHNDYEKALNRDPDQGFFVVDEEDYEYDG